LQDAKGAAHSGGQDSVLISNGLKPDIRVEVTTLRLPAIRAQGLGFIDLHFERGLGMARIETHNRQALVAKCKSKSVG
jgi:hypothetical protein